MENPNPIVDINTSSARKTTRKVEDDSSIMTYGKIQPQAVPLEEAILGVIGSMDKPSSPAGEGKQDFHNRLFGRSHAPHGTARWVNGILLKLGLLG